MSSEYYVEHVREARKRSSVLKIKVLTVRSGDRQSPIFIYEGKTDVGPYETWINRIDNDLHYKCIPGEGKAQVLEFRESVHNSSSSDFSSLYFFLDRDFDGLRGYPNTKDTFCLDAYSFENYLVTCEVLVSILTDEFECAAEPEAIQDVRDLYEKVSADFCEAMADANFRIFLAARYGLDRGRLENRINRFVNIKVDAVERLYNSNTVNDLIPLANSAPEREIDSAMKDFNDIENPMKSYRGKYMLLFFLTWLDFLASSRRCGSFPFKRAENIKFNRATMSERSLASRSPLPEGLKEFILSI
ncbi:DUF4435 domain-containing protein [Marinobacter sp. M1N3S26]|uniref:DUF4435 domain-containing protein n=1 Tax=Marinobacter sp. M1N3S26 TaxID=3382299 RepID=UPI00387A9194